MYKLLFIIFLTCSISCNSQKDMKIETVKNIELEKYLGKWYEIARLDHSFERNLVNVTATYSLREDGKISVINEGNKHKPDGKHKIAKGKAWFPNENDTGKLKVQFFWPFSGDYYIAELGEQYDYVLILSSSPKYMWILARKPELEREIYEKLVAKAKKYGIKTENLIKVTQVW